MSRNGFTIIYGQNFCLNHVLDDKHKRDEQRSKWIISCYSASEIAKQQEWESDYWLG